MGFNGCRTGLSLVRGSYSGEKQTKADIIHLASADLLDATKTFG